MGWMPHTVPDPIHRGWGRDFRQGGTPSPNPDESGRVPYSLPRSSPAPEDGRFGDGSDGETMATIQRGTGPFAGAQLG